MIAAASTIQQSTLATVVLILAAVALVLFIVRR